MSDKNDKNGKREEESKEPANQTPPAAEEKMADKTAKADKADKAEKEEEVKEELVKKSELDKATALAEDYKRRLYAVTAEYDNYRKRMANTAAQRYAEGRADVMEKLFPVGDNLSRALAVCTDEKMKQGLEMVIKAYRKILEEENIEEFDPAGEEFNAATSNAVTALAAEEGDKPGTVKMTFAKGYKRGDKILRFAQVAVVKED